MSLSDWMKIIDELEEYRKMSGISPIITLWGGEPLVSPNFDQIARELKDRNFSLELITNGTKIDQHLDVIKSCIDKVYVSIDGDRKTHDAIRGEGVFDKVKANLLALSHPDVTVMSVVTEELLAGLLGFLAELAGLGIKSLLLQNMIGLDKGEIAEYKAWMLSAFGINATEIDSWEASGKIDFSAELTEKLAGINKADYPFEIIHKEHTKSGDFVCKSPYCHAHIAWNGNVLFCTDFYDFSAGNVKCDTLFSIFANEKSESFRREIEKNNCPTCRHCSWRMS